MSSPMTLLICCFPFREPQYKYHFRKWKWKKNISMSKKNEIVRYRQSQAAAGRSTQLEYKGKTVEEKKLRRHLKQTVKRDIAINHPGNMFGDITKLTGSKFLLGNSM